MATVIPRETGSGELTRSPMALDWAWGPPSRDGRKVIGGTVLVSEGTGDVGGVAHITSEDVGLKLRLEKT